MISASKRLQKELVALSKNADEHIELSLRRDDVMDWCAVIQAPSGSVYEGFEFDLAISVPSNYPMAPPRIRFETKIFHPNVDFHSGEICLDILKKEWSPAWSLQSACRAIIALLADPAADSPLNVDAGNMIRGNDHRAFRSMAHMYCVDYARKGPTVR